MTQQAVKPEDLYQSVAIEEAAGFPIYGRRKPSDEGVLRRDAKYVRPYTPFLLRESSLTSASGDAIANTDRMLGVLSRETPVDAAGGPYSRLLDWAHNLALPESERDPNAMPQNMMFVISGPGLGKTHLPKVMSKAFGFHHELIGSGEAGGDIDELVVAHEFQGESAGDLIKKIEAALASPNSESLNPLLFEQLRSAHFLEEAHEFTAPQLNLPVVMGKKDGAEDEAQLEHNIEKLYHIAERSGIPVKQEKGIGIRKVNGRVLDKLLQVKEQFERSGKAEPVLITLDEFNRFRSFGKKLQNFWEVVGGASSEPVTLVDAQGTPHVFTPEMLRYVFVYMTGNDPKKVPGARDLDHSMLDRIGENRIFRLEDFSAKDWQHRLEQQMMGIGIDLHLRAGGEQNSFWSRHPDEFSDHLLAKRQQGLTAAEQHLYTPMQRDMLRNWERVHHGVGQVADFIAAMDGVYQDPRHRAEINRMETKPSITPRLLNHMANEMRSLHVKGDSLEDNLALLQSGKAKPTHHLSTGNLGTRMKWFLQDFVDKAHPDVKSPLRHDLYRHLYLKGIISKAEAKRYMGDADISEMQLTAETQLLEDILNIDPAKGFNKELRPLQRTLAEMIRKQHPELAERDDDSIISLAQVADAVQSLQQGQAESQEASLPTDLRQLLLPKIQRSGDQVQFSIRPTVVANATMRNKVAEPQEGLALAGVQTSYALPTSLATTPELLLGFALPGKHAPKVKALWNTHEGEVSAMPEDAMLLLHQTQLQQIEKIEQEEGNPEQPQWLIKEEQQVPEHHAGALQTMTLHTTGIKVNSTGQQEHFPDAVRIISCPSNPNVPNPVPVLIVGQTAIDPQLRAYLKERRQATYVNVNDSGAFGDINKALQIIVDTARENAKQANPNDPNLNETADTGIWRQLHAAFDAPALEDVNDNTDFAEKRKETLVKELMNTKRTIRNHHLPEHVMSRDWEGFVKSREANANLVSAARA